MRHTNYDEIADAYDRRYSEEDYGDIARALIAFIGDKSPKVLEVGCGTGHWLQQLQNRNIDAIGIDLSCSMLSRARQKLRSGIGRGPARLRNVWVGHRIKRASRSMRVRVE